MGINYFICLVSIFAFHHILDTGGLFFNFTVPAMGVDEIGSGPTSNNNANNAIDNGDMLNEGGGEYGNERFRKITSETREHMKLRLNEIYFCNDTIYRCLISVQCRDATTEEKEHVFIMFREIDDEIQNSDTIELQIEST